jgi:hypothetical protein
MIVLAIDPGNESTAFIIWDSKQKIILNKNKLSNCEFLNLLRQHSFQDTIEIVAIEMISSYGMAVGQEIFDSCVWLGRYVEICSKMGLKYKFIFRKTIKMHHCGSVQAKDGNVNKVLQQKYGKDNSTKEPNKVYINEFTEKNNSAKYMNNDLWAAFALATYITEEKDYPIKNLMEREENKLSKSLLDYK